MPTANRGSALADFPVGPTYQRLEYDQFLAKLGNKDRLAVEKHVALRETAPDGGQHAQLWRRLAATLMSISPFSVKCAGPKALQYFVQDGKYRMQSFALDDSSEGHITVYCADVLDQLVAGGALQPDHTEPGRYNLGSSPEHLRIERIEQGATDQPALFKAMLGWKRKAMKIALPIDSSETRIAAVEAICALSVTRIANAGAPPATAAPAAAGTK